MPYTKTDVVKACFRSQNLILEEFAGDIVKGRLTIQRGKVFSGYDSAPTNGAPEQPSFSERYYSMDKVPMETPIADVMEKLPALKVGRHSFTEADVHKLRKQYLRRGKHRLGIYRLGRKYGMQHQTIREVLFSDAVPFGPGELDALLAKDALNRKISKAGYAGLSAYREAKCAATSASTTGKPSRSRRSPRARG